MDGNISGVTKYYNVLSTLNNFRKMKARKDLCDICFEPDCEHYSGSIRRKHAQKALSFWVEIAKMEAKNEMTWFPDDNIVPRFPIGGSYNSNTKYDIMPCLNLPLTIVNVQDTVTVYTEGVETYVDLPRLKTKMVHYGYIWEEQFYIIKSFRNGSFLTSKSKFRLLSEIVDNDYIEGFLYIPRGTTPYDMFAEQVCKL